MAGVEVGIASVICILILIYAGIHVAVALGLVSFIGVWIYRGSIDVAISLLAAATQDPRFRPVPMEDMPSLHLSVTVLGRLEAWSYPRDPDQLAIGREGLKVAQGARQGGQNHRCVHEALVVGRKYDRTTDLGQVLETVHSGPREQPGQWQEPQPQTELAGRSHEERLAPVR